MRIIRNVPTNVIFGFLGVGKTSAILHWLHHKPENQHWAVLVNEFGEVGIDGAIYEQHGVAVKELPGGCMCCAQGLPLQVAVNRLLRHSVPDRLLIETSGIGHPVGVLNTLHGEGFRGVLDLKAAIALVDPEQLLDPACTGSALFLQQLAVADVLVANKTDLASTSALCAFDSLPHRFTIDKALTTRTRFGQMQAAWLDHPHTDRKQEASLFELSEAAEQPWVTYHWRFPSTSVFDAEALQAWVTGLDVVRLKGLVLTTSGSLAFNCTAGQPKWEPVGRVQESRIQIIDHKADSQARQRSRERSLEAGLQACLAADSEARS